MYGKISFSFFVFILLVVYSCGENQNKRKSEYTVNKDSNQVRIAQNPEERKSQCDDTRKKPLHISKAQIQTPHPFTKYISYNKLRKYKLIKEWTNKTLKSKSNYPTPKQIKDTKFLLRKNIASKYTDYISNCALQENISQKKKIACAIKKRMILEHN